MVTVKTTLDPPGKGVFKLYEDTTERGEMVVSVHGNKLTVYHIQVAPEAEGKGYAKQLLDTLVDYTRAHHLQVVPLCPYVHARFRHHPDQYADLWTESVS